MHISRTSKPYIFLTMGDPAGIGPEILMKSLASPEIKGLAVFIAMGDLEVLKEYMVPGGMDINPLKSVRKAGEAEYGALNVIDPGPWIGKVVPGKPTDDGSGKALSCIDSALEIMKTMPGNIPIALVTAPLSKERVARISPGFVGHTEYLQRAYSSGMVTMVMAGEHMNVVPVTRHIPLKDVVATLTTEMIYRTLEQVIEARYLISGSAEAKIGVCALNPHCGEGGRIGFEEIEVIAPAVREALSIYGNIDGPLSADVMFYKAIRKKIDIVVAMYHDQCLAPFKMVDFDTGVNMTLGLAHVRTSPDHGTAFDIAGRGMANSCSMQQAIKLAVKAAERSVS